MINNKKVVVVLPAYNAAKTLEKTYFEKPALKKQENFYGVDDYICKYAKDQ